VRLAFEDAKRAFGADVAQSYVDHLAGPEDSNADDDGLRSAYVKAVALATVPSVREKIDQTATEVVEEWFSEYRVAMLGLSDERRDAYDEIRAQAVEPQLRTLQRPRTRLEDFVEEIDGQLRAAEVVEKHLMSDETGWFPIADLNEWERDVVRKEVGRTNCVAWYRNPSVSSGDSLGITYRDTVGNWRALHPDFIVFNEIDGVIRPSIVDPHGTYLDDALVKLQGLARYAEEHGDDYHRIDALSAGTGNDLRVLDMKKKVVRQTVLNGGMKAAELFDSQLGEAFS
jgi:type III restriction enzyme